MSSARAYGIMQIDVLRSVDRLPVVCDDRWMFAACLMQAGEGQFGTDESVFNKVLCTRSPAQLRATFDAYKKLTDRDIEDTIKSETSGDLRDGYLAVGMTCTSCALTYSSVLSLLPRLTACSIQYKNRLDTQDLS